MAKIFAGCSRQMAYDERLASGLALLKLAVQGDREYHQILPFLLQKLSSLEIVLFCRGVCLRIKRGSAAEEFDGGQCCETGRGVKTEAIRILRRSLILLERPYYLEDGWYFCERCVEIA